MANGTRLALLATATPLLCCGAALLAQLVLRNDQAALAARYAALQFSPWQGQPIGGETSSFLHGIAGSREYFVRNPAQWNSDISMRSFFIVPALVVITLVGLLGMTARSWTRMGGALLGAAALLWTQADFLHMVAGGWEIGLDATADQVVLNGDVIASMSSVERFVGWTTHRRKGGDDWHLAAVLLDGRSVEVTGPAARPDELAAAAPLTALLGRRVPAPVAQIDCASGRCLAISPQDMDRLRQDVGRALEAPAP